MTQFQSFDQEGHRSVCRWRESGASPGCGRSHEDAEKENPDDFTKGSNCANFIEVMNDIGRTMCNKRFAVMVLATMLWLVGNSVGADEKPIDVIEDNSY